MNHKAFFSVVRECNYPYAHRPARKLSLFVTAPVSGSDYLFCFRHLGVRINSETLVKLGMPSETFRGDLKRSCLLFGESHPKGGENGKCAFEVAVLEQL